MFQNFSRIHFTHYFPNFKFCETFYTRDNFVYFDATLPVTFASKWEHKCSDNYQVNKDAPVTVTQSWSRGNEVAENIQNKKNT